MARIQAPQEPQPIKGNQFNTYVYASESSELSSNENYTNTNYQEMGKNWNGYFNSFELKKKMREKEVNSAQETWSEKQEGCALKSRLRNDQGKMVYFWFLSSPTGNSIRKQQICSFRWRTEKPKGTIFKNFLLKKQTEKDCLKEMMGSKN